jgi:hypothetical protein
MVGLRNILADRNVMEKVGIKKWHVKKKMTTELLVVVEAKTREAAKALAEIEFDNGNCKCSVAETKVSADVSNY